MKKIVLITSSLLLASELFCFDVPKLRDHVNDYAGILSSDTIQMLNSSLKDYQDRTHNQIFILTTDSIKDAGSIEQYSIAVAEKWKPGFKGSDNGILMVVAIKERKIRIEVGYGLEGKLPDILASRIIREQISPRFKHGLYNDGVKAGVVAIINDIGGYEVSNVDISSVNVKHSPWKKIIPVVIFLLFIFGRFMFIPLYAFGEGRRRGGGGFFFGSGGGFSGGGGGFGGGGSSGSW